MRPGSMIAGGCLVLLASLKFSERAYEAATMFVVLALAVLGWGLRAPRRTSGPPTAPPSREEVERAQAAHSTHRRGWALIALFGLTVSVVGVFVFPPMALIVAGLSLYSVHRMRQSTRSTRLLGGAAGAG